MAFCACPKGRGWDVQACALSLDQYGSVSVREQWPKLDCDCWMAVHAMASGEEYLLRNQRCEGIRTVLCERQPKLDALLWRGLPVSWRAALRQACFQGGSFIGHENQQCPFAPPCLAFLCCSAHTLPSSLVLWIRSSVVAQGELWAPPDFSLWCGNAGAHNGCDSKTNASSLLLMTLAEAPRCSETTDGAIWGEVLKKKHPQPLNFLF